MEKGQMLKDLPTEVIMNIQSYLMGRPEDLRIKHNKQLKKIQQKYKINYNEPHIFDSMMGSVRMFYDINHKILKPHMIDNPININRVVNFINHFQYGISEEWIDEEEEEEYINLDETDGDEIIIDDENPIKSELILTSVFKFRYTSDIMGVVEYDYAHETSYNDALKSRSLLKQAFKKYVDKVNSIMKNDDRCVKLLHFKVEVTIDRQYED